jgi:hypothetical protein
VTILRRLLVIAAVIAVIVGVVYLALPLRVPVEKPLAYWKIDDHSLGIVVGDGYQLGCSVVSVGESSDAVRVHAQCFERVIPVPNAAMLQPYVMEVFLVDPLGSRTVYDGLGNPARLCPTPAPNCDIAG